MNENIHELKVSFVQYLYLIYCVYVLRKATSNLLTCSVNSQQHIYVFSISINLIIWLKSVQKNYINVFSSTCDILEPKHVLSIGPGVFEHLTHSILWKQWKRENICGICAARVRALSSKESPFWKEFWNEMCDKVKFLSDLWSKNLSLNLVKIVIFFQN